MTKPLKTPLKTASRALFLRGEGHFSPKKSKKNLKTPPAVTYRGIIRQKKFTGKEADPETGLYYYGARYLDPKTSRWISGDPALGEYLPVAPLGDEERKRNQSLPGMGGVFNYVNLHVYHYAGNNPVKYVDPDGEKINELSEKQWNTVKQDINDVVNNLNIIIQELTDFESGKIDALSSDLVSASQDFLGVDFSLPFDARHLGKYLTKIRDSLGSMTRNDFRYNDSTDDYALTLPWGNRIYLGNKYFSSTNSGYDTRQGTLIHEKTHKFTILATNDRAKTVDQALILKVNDRVNHKASCANNWEYFYERLFTKGR
jgi:RHS repeat-associated protein